MKIVKRFTKLRSAQVDVGQWILSFVKLEEFPLENCIVGSSIGWIIQYVLFIYSYYIFYSCFAKDPHLPKLSLCQLQQQAYSDFICLPASRIVLDLIVAFTGSIVFCTHTKLHKNHIEIRKGKDRLRAKNLTNNGIGQIEYLTVLQVPEQWKTVQTP